MHRLTFLCINLMIASLLLTGCQKKEQAVPPPEARSEQQLDNEYRALLAEVGLYGGGEAPPPGQIDTSHYGQVLAVAAGHGSTELLVRLLSARTDINLNEQVDGRSLLHAAAASLHATNCNLLLERGLDPNTRDAKGRTALHLVVSQTDGVNLARLLLARGAQVNSRDDRGMPPLMYAEPASIKLLIDKGADLNAQDANGNTALHWVSYRKGYDAARILITLGAALDSQNSAGKTPLLQAVESKNLQMVELLLKAGANPESNDINGVSPRQAADKSGNKAMVGLFIQPLDGNKGHTP